MTPRSRGGGGKLSRRAAIALISGGGLLGLTSTGAFTQVDGNREFDISSASDENAFLSIEGLDENKNYTDGHTFTISNKFNEVLSRETVKTAGSFGDDEWLKIEQTTINNCPLDNNLDPYSGSGEPDCHSFTIEIPEELKGEDSSGNGNGNGNGNSDPNPNENAEESACNNSNGNVPFCGTEVSDTIIIIYSGPDTTIELNRKITLTT